jgi:ABC-type branched-subunit amino acid transport system substrate-binding protein
VIGDANTHVPGIPPLPFENAMTAATRGFNARNKTATINATFCDSQLNNNAALACAKEATTGHYDAVVFGNTNEDALIVKETSAAGIPTLAASVNDPQTWNNKSVYCLTSTLSGEVRGLGYVAKQLGVSKAGLVTIPLAGQDAMTASSQQGFKQAGVGYTGNVTVPVTATDWSAYVAQALAPAPNGLFLEPSFNPAADAAFQIAKQSSPSIKFIEPSFVFASPVLATQPAVQGAGISAWAIPPDTSGVQGTSLFRADVAKWGKTSAAVSEPYELEWLAIQIAGEVTSTIHGSVTPTSFTRALKADKNVNTFGLTPPFNGGVRNVDGQSCVSNGTFVRAQVMNNKIVAVKPGQFISVATDRVVATK